MNCFLRASRVLEGNFEPLLYIAVEYSFANNYKLAYDFMRDADNAEPSNPVVLHEQAAVNYMQGDFTGILIRKFSKLIILFFSRRWSLSQSNPTCLQSHTERNLFDYSVQILQRLLGTNVWNDGIGFDAFGTLRRGTWSLPKATCTWSKQSFCMVKYWRLFGLSRSFEWSDWSTERSHSHETEWRGNYLGNLLLTLLISSWLNEQWKFSSMQ